MPRTTIRSEDITAAQVKTADMAIDPTDASNLSSGSVPAGRLGNVDTAGIVANKDDIALLAFRVAANGSFGRYNLVDQSVDAFEDATGVNASASSNEVRSESNYYFGGTAGSPAVHAITATGSSTWTAVTTQNVEILVVAGGGQGGSNHGGGGGAGGVVHHPAYPVVSGVEYDITVGAGNVGAGNSGSNGPATGGNSIFNVNSEGSQSAMTALGGGSGAGASTTQGAAGGSGGGAGGHSSPGSFPYAGNQGNSGGGTGYGSAGSTQSINSMGTGGGGGGAAAQGATTNPNGQQGGVGGAGKEFSTFAAYGTDSNNSIGSGPGSGSGKGYFGGGGGGGRSSIGGTGTTAGGVGGGGNGGNTNATKGYDALANTGGGGGGGSNNGGGGANGGSGIVLIYAMSSPVGGGDMTLISNAQTAQAVPTKADVVMTYTNGAGTNTINTDIVASVSRDGGTTYTTATLASQGTTGGHTITTANDIDISGQPSGSSMVWKVVTANQSQGSKEARIQGVSLGWS